MTDTKDITATAEEIGRREILSDMGLFAAWLDQQKETSREDFGIFGTLSTPRLLRVYILNVLEKSTPELTFEACKELRRRYLADEAASVRERALKASEGGNTDAY